MELGKMGADQFLNLALLSLAVLILFKFIFRKAKNLPPGPRALPVIGHLHLIKKPMHKTMTNFAEKYGDVIMLKFGVRNMVVVSSPKTAEECFTKNDIIFANRNETVSGKLLNYNCTTIGLSSYGDYWRNLRRIAALEILSQNRLALFTNIRQEEVHFIMKELYEECKDLPVKVILKSKLSDLSLNIMMRMIAGKRYCGKDVTTEEARQFLEVIQEMLEFHGIVNLEDFIPVFKFVDLKGLKKKMMVLMKKIDGLLQNLVDEHHKRRNGSSKIVDDVSSSRKKRTFIDIMLTSQESEPEFLTDQTIKAITLSLLAGGTETTASTLEWAMSLLLNNPEAIKKAQDEIEKYVGHDRLLDEEDLPKLTYLNNIITETLRLYPPIPLLLPHKSVEDCTISGYNVPKGSMLMVNIWKIQRDPELWDEPDKFKPERFDGKSGDGYKYLPFGAGRRACPGSNLGKRVAALTLGSLLQCFEWDKIGKVVDMTEESGMTMPKLKPLEVMCSPRKVAVQAFSAEE